MEKVKLYKTKRISAWFYFIFGSLVLVYGVPLTVIALISGFDMRFLGGDWVYIIFIPMGIIHINQGISLIKQEKCFVGWDESRIRYLLPGNKDIETIRISEITGIKIKLHEVRIWLNDDTIKKLDLNNVEYDPLIRIKNYFRELQSKVAETG